MISILLEVRMNEKLLHTPEGVRDIHCDETIKKNELQRKILAVFHRYGFRDVQTPTFEFLDIFDNERGTIDTKLMYKFFDRDGNILALRPDITPSIARFVATFYNHETTPKRLCYVGNTFRNNESYQLKLKEFTQAGVELIGVDSADADAEILALVINALLVSGLTDFQIDIGQAGFFKGLIEEAGLDKAQEEELRNLIDEKNYISVEELLNKLNISDEHKKVFLDLPKLFGSEKVLESARALTTNDKALKALDRLEKVYAILKDYECQDYVSFDLGMISQINYYTGIVFRGFTFGTGVSVVDGGRYDTLLREFGHDAPAVGFAIIIDELMNALERQNIELDSATIDTLLVYEEHARTEAIKIAENMRREGMSIQVGLLDKSEEENLAYAKSQNIGGIMVFKTKEHVTLINCETLERQSLTVRDLLKEQVN